MTTATSNIRNNPATPRPELHSTPWTASLGRELPANVMATRPVAGLGRDQAIKGFRRDCDWLEIIRKAERSQANRFMKAPDEMG